MTRSTPVSDSPCCGSARVPEPERVPSRSSSCCSAPKTDTKPADSSSPRGWRAYQPLLVIVGLSVLVAVALQMGSDAPSVMAGMSQFMGFFLVIFAMLKLFDLGGFARGFAKYDLAAGVFPPYAYLYPFLELGFGLALLAGLAPVTVNACLAGLMFFGALGVFRALWRRENLRCACLGSTLNVPLSTVAVVENVGMGLMALATLGTFSL